VGYHIAAGILKSVMEDKEFRDIQLAGLETSSIPIIAATQLAFLQAGVEVNAFTVRKERKAYGICNLIEGIPNEHPVVFIDDTINYGTTMSHLFDVVYYELGVRPAKNAYCIVQYREYPNHVYNDWLIKLNTIFMASEFDKTYDPEKYWLPEDVRRDVNKRSHYV
jgi:orotate phosphoribosyltransferase